jgi:hypothetical protein
MLGLGLGLTKLNMVLAKAIFNDTFWQNITLQWQNINTTWN